MINPSQFQLFNPGPESPTVAPAPVNPPPARSGQVFDFHGNYGPLSSTRRAIPQQTASQLPMFMSAREIMGSHSPLDADRDMVEMKDQWGMTQEKEEADTHVWERKAEEATLPPDEYASEVGSNSETGTNTFAARQWQSQHLPHRKVTFENLTEEMEDEQHAFVDQRVEDRAYGPGGSRLSLFENIRQQGVQQPVRLGQTKSFKTGRPEVVGGHHRIAAQAKIDPDALIPVLHDRNIMTAKQDRGYTYR